MDGVNYVISYHNEQFIIGNRSPEQLLQEGAINQGRLYAILFLNNLNL